MQLPKQVLSKIGRFFTKKLKTKNLKIITLAFAVIIFIFYVGLLLFAYKSDQDLITALQIQSIELGETNSYLITDLENNLKELEELKNEDQYKVNLDLKRRISDIENTFKKAVGAYEDLLELKGIAKDVSELDEIFTDVVVLLANQNYEDAETLLNDLSGKIASERQTIISSFTIPVATISDTNPPTSGYRRQQVSTNIGTYLVSVIAADLSSTRVIVDTASSGDCGNDCPTLSLSSYAGRSNAYAGINGSYFCPATYPSCAGKTNSFDTLLMNKDKTYFNSGNNVYSNVPAVIFGGGYIRFVAQSQEWGRDTGIDSMIANQPLLVQGGNIQFTGDGDPKKGSKAGRSFVANKGSSVYIGVVHNATVAESAIVMKAMGMENALNLDSGGSTALWSGGYKVGPGRNLPNVILFVRK